ncbi:uncharacterized protein LDX57_008404 [Aspergillus melleus]|uniref:uncharacterized protein n=1 Tax=Aspergillus melleus TaxID=138277 RepID=UPI001E8ECF0B|nr:uncharacterized protein LDX57_008404 [Aspergillus melleus]KAH8430741.1 hypothetical protein LDX57_008404 [Aspergillus melleus]
MATAKIEQKLGYEMQVSAKDGNLAQLQTQLAHWEAGITGNNLTQEDYLCSNITVAEKKEVCQALGRKYHPAEPIDLIYIMLNRLMIQVSRRNQVNVIQYLLEDRKWPVSRIAVQRAMETDSFDVLELFQKYGWEINEPIKQNHCTILRCVNF